MRAVGDLISDLENNPACDYRVQHALGPTVQQRTCGQPVSEERPQTGAYRISTIRKSGCGRKYGEVRL